MSEDPRGHAAVLTRVAWASLAGALIALGCLRVVGREIGWGLIVALVIGAVVFCVLGAATLLSEPAREPAAAVTGSPSRGPAFSWPGTANPAPSGQQYPQPGISREIPPPVPVMPAIPSMPTVPAASAPISRERPVWRPPPPAPAEAPAEPVTPPTVPVNLIVPLAGGEWRHAAPGHSREDRARAVQCPRCGDFGVDVRQERSSLGFACQRCACTWSWQPGSAWPATVIRPR